MLGQAEAVLAWDAKVRGAFSSESSKEFDRIESEADDERFHKIAVIMRAEEE